LVFPASSVGRDSNAKQGEFLAEQRRDDIVPNGYGYAIGGLYRAAHGSQRMNQSHTGPSHAAMVAVAERVFPVLSKAWHQNAGAPSLSPVAAGNQVLA